MGLRNVEQTKRDLKSRIAEHKRFIKFQRPEKSALCEHLTEFDHAVNWSGFTILKYETNYHRKLRAESWFINAYLKIINRSDGDRLLEIYRPLFKLFKLP